MVRCFHHHTHDRLRAGFTDKDTASVTQCLGYGLDCCLHYFVILCGLFIGHTNILQHLRIDLQRLSQLAHRQFLGQHDFHHFQTGQDAVTGAGVLAENDMTTLLTTDTAAVLRHVLIDVLVAHSGLCIADALLIESLVQAEVGHNGSNNSVCQQFATFLHIAAVDVQDMITSDDITLFIHTQATVSIAVIGETNIQTLLYHELLQTLNMGRAGIVVDVQTVRLCIDDIGIGTQRIKHRLSNIPACTVGAVQTNLDTLEGVDTEADQVAHIAVTACHIVHRAADMLTVSKRQFRPILVEHVELAVDVVLDKQ